MNYTRPDLADRLAAEYVLGTLSGGARRRFETLLPAHPTLRDAVAAWQVRLTPLSQVVPPVEPTPQVWQRLEARLDPAASTRRTSAPVRRWQTLDFWRAWAVFATAAAVWFAVLLGTPSPSRPPMVVVLSAPEGASSFVAGVAADGRSLLVRPLAPVSLKAGQALELWAVPVTGAPRSLGLISPERPTVLQPGRVPEGVAAFAVSLEPAGGSKTGAPTGPILYSGSLRL
ncbi:anti-sigma factor [Caldimonas brevitalea]|uniref:Anti-sigma K factor RskA C-terminal domain-containing protein n=1 Tax=Caldimonas brevitalea TaxID=413882 RepID=A0A0G3BLF3_9BURK|nr:anti-sigma factor [Caldimonas brevitalea]AKJ30257.1 hypothetical protein AAW51_3566 [Caldimonas brevitalea]